MRRCIDSGQRQFGMCTAAEDLNIWKSRIGFALVPLQNAAVDWWINSGYMLDMCMCMSDTLRHDTAAQTKKCECKCYYSGPCLKIKGQDGSHSQLTCFSFSYLPISERIATKYH